MKQTKTATEMLAQIEKDFFKGVDLAEASLLKGDERRTFRLAQVERLLTEQKGLPLAMWLSDMFWTADEGRVQMEPVNPLLSLTEQQTLTDEEMQRLRLILEVAGLCHDVSLHFTFDLKEAFGIRKNDFRVSNKQLVEWLTTTEYERIAMHTAYIMRKVAIYDYADRHYMPAQDGLAELFSREHRELIREPNLTEMPPRDYVRVILDEMLRIERHWQRGRRLKLKPNVVILHDEIYGVVPHQFDKVVLQVAQALDEFINREVLCQLVEGNEAHNAGIMRRFVEKVHELREEYLAEGWVRDESLEFGYLMAHAEWCGFSYLNEGGDDDDE